MSMVSTHLGRRVVTPTPSDTDAWQSLAELDRGATGVVVDVCDDVDAASSRRLFDLGFAPGAEVQLVRRAPLADPLVFRVAGYEIALRRVQARCVRVVANP